MNKCHLCGTEVYSMALHYMVCEKINPEATEEDKEFDRQVQEELIENWEDISEKLKAKS